MTTHCICCGFSIENKRLLEFESMPTVAQNFSTQLQESVNQQRNMKIGQCKSCGLVQLIDFKLVPYYKEVIRSSAVSKPMEDFRNEQFKLFSAEYKLQDSSYIELGCGYGEYLRIMARYINASKGIEYSDEGINACKCKGLDVEKLCLDDSTVLKETFDSFGIFNFLEHIPNPVSYLRKVATGLSEDAVGIVEVPNFDVMQKESVYCDFSTEHIAYYSENTLRTVLSLSGFNVIRIEEVWHGDILSATVKKRRSFNPSDFQTMLEKQRVILDEITSNYKKNEIVIWGAGHQSLTAIKQLEIEDKVKAIVDSAPSKQMKYAPASGIPIYSPAWLNDNEFKLLIINASSYTDEVVNIVQNDYSAVQKIVVIRNGIVSEIN